MRYLVTFNDAEYDTDTLTGYELEKIETISGTGWGFINPLMRMKDLLAMLGVFLARDHGEDGAEAIMAGPQITLGTLAKMFKPLDDEYPSEAPPFEEPETSS